jgi:transposase
MTTWLHEWLFRRSSREKIVTAVRRGLSKKSQAAHIPGVSLSSLKRYVKKADHGESLAPKKSPGSAPKLDEKAAKLLKAHLKHRPLWSPSKSAATTYTLPYGTLGESLDDLPRYRPAWIK